MGEVIYDWCDSHGVSMRWLALKIGMKPQTLGGKLRGRCRMSAEEYGRICDVLGVPLDYFYSLWRAK